MEKERLKLGEESDQCSVAVISKGRWERLSGAGKTFKSF
jgi:hypothetical protein